MLVKDLVYWITERDTVRQKKESNAPKPWSKDPTFWSTYFCNVRREDDKVTKWVRENWPHDNVGLVVLARMFNLPAHLEELIPVTNDWEAMKYKTTQRRAKNEKIFNGAYLITTCGVKMDKVDYVYKVAQESSQLNFEFSSLLDTHNTLRTITGLGSFLAAQVVADLKNTEGHPLQKAPDWHTWCAHGPGSVRGINTIEGFSGTTPNTFQGRIARLWGLTRPELPSELQDIHMQDFQNCLCEFSKYAKVENGGRSKRKYNGR